MLPLLPLISAALSLADKVGITEWLGDKVGGEMGVKTAKTITGLAQTVTGTKSPEEALAAIQENSQLAAELKNKIIDNEHELRVAYLADVNSARDMYKGSDHQMADKIADRVIIWNLPFIALLVGVNVGVISFVEDPIIAVSVGNIVGASIAYLWNERSTVINFFFGSSKGSKDKADKLAGK
jgi:hypothetical protein